MQAQCDLTTAPQTPGTATSGHVISMQRQRGGLLADHTSTTYHMGNNSGSDWFSNLAFARSFVQVPNTQDCCQNQLFWPSPHIYAKLDNRVDHFCQKDQVILLNITCTTFLVYH